MWLTQRTVDAVKDQIIMNFLARGTVSLDSMLMLSESLCNEDCWPLHRGFVERFLLLNRIIERRAFVDFERWSLQRVYDEVNTALRHPDIRAKLPLDWLEQAKFEQRLRRNRLRTEPITNWQRPRTEDLAVGKLSLLYPAGFSIASPRLHPTAYHGKEDYERLIGAQEVQGFDPAILYISLLLQHSIVHVGLAASSVNWIGIIDTLLNQMGSWLESGSQEYKFTFLALTSLGPDCPWCEPRGPS